MENIREKETSTPSPGSIRDQIEQLKLEQSKLASKVYSKKEKKEFKVPFTWKSKAKKSFSKTNEDKILCLYLTKKGIWLGPIYLPIIGGNIVIYKNKAHEYDPRDLTFMKIGFKTYPLYVMREIDRRAVSNRDYKRVVKRGLSTKNDEVLLKMLKLATVEKAKVAVNKNLWWIIGLVLAAIIAAYVFFA